MAITGKWLFIVAICFFYCLISAAQKTLNFPDTIQKKRILALATTGGAVYSGGMVVLYNQWYSKAAQSRFHWFDDKGEWLQMDKVGHSYSGYMEARMAYGMIRWTGINDRKSIYYAAGAGLLMQTSIEIFDAFSAKWGFSWSDIGANLIGVGAFAGQQLGWGEQRFSLKVSSDLRKYPATPVYPDQLSGIPDNLQRRAQDLYGNSILSSLLKDYNAQTYWLSFNLGSFMAEKPKWLPGWLNLAIGYSAENMYGGFSNTWDFQGNSYSLDPMQIPRYRQFLVSPDIDWTRIRTQSPWVKALFFGLNMIKLPMPTLEMTSHGNIHWHWFYF